MTAPNVMTGDELAAIPLERRYYVCQQCKRAGAEPDEFRMITVFNIGFIVCRNCLEGEGEC